MNKALTAPLLSDLWRCFEDHWVLGFQADHHPYSPSAQKKKKASKARSMRTRAFEGKCLFCLSCRCHLSRGSEGTEWIPYFREEVKWGVCDALTSRRFLNKSLTMIKQLKGAARTWNNGFYVTQKNIPVHLVFSEIKHLEKCLLSRGDESCSFLLCYSISSRIQGNSQPLKQWRRLSDWGHRGRQLQGACF